MCISKAELDQRIRKIKNLKLLKSEVEKAIDKIESEVIDFLQENPECHVVDKKGRQILQYMGVDYKATYAEQSRETVDKAQVKQLLSEEEFLKVRNVTFFNVLRIK